MKKLPLPHGLFAIVDDEDFERVSKFRWSLNKSGYAIRNIRKSDGSHTTQRLSRFIMNAPSGVEVDHRHGKLLDHRKSELRLCTKSQNMWNQGKRKNNASGRKGVAWNKWASKWRAQIRANGKRIHIGYFIDINEASAAYADAAKKHHGEFART